MSQMQINDGQAYLCEHCGAPQCFCLEIIGDDSVFRYSSVGELRHHVSKVRDVEKLAHMIAFIDAIVALEAKHDQLRQTWTTLREEAQSEVDTQKAREAGRAMAAMFELREEQAFCRGALMEAYRAA